jgi:alpha 1,6-mannosyltransferase
MLLSCRPTLAFNSLTSRLLIILSVTCLLIYHTGISHWKLVAAVRGKTQLATVIPEKIWYKIGPKGLSTQLQEWMNTCLKKNPTYQFEIMTDLSSADYVRENFAYRPDIVETYLALPFDILKADLLRYLLLFAEGGIWSDLDVSCEDTPIHDWIPAQYLENASVVVGWEFDVGWGENIFRQFTSWIIMAKPESPHMLMVINDILEEVRKKTEEHKVVVPDLTLDMIGDVVDLTGPRRLTRSIIKSLEVTLNATVDMKNISGLLEPKLIGDVLILPGYSFAASANHYEENQSGPPFVTHHYAGSWKNEYRGERR